MQKSIFDIITEKRGGFYVHALVVDCVDDITATVDEINEQFIESHGIDAVKEFFNTVELHYNGENEETENEVYSFSFDNYIEEIN